MKQKLKSLILTGAVSAVLMAGSATACTLSNWNGGSNGGVVAQNPEGDGNADSGDNTVGGATARYSGECAMKAAAAGDYVQDNSPSAETSAIVRFYVLPQSFSGTADLFVAYSNEAPSGEVLKVTYDGTDFHFTTGAGSFSTAASTGWNAIEMAWSRSGATNIWVNADAATDPATGAIASSSSATIEAAALGPVAWTGAAGNLNFDAYEMHRTTPVGTDSVLPKGDANNDGTNVDVLDLITIRGEILNKVPSPGQPDCTIDGIVNVLDVICVRDVILNP